MHCGSKMPHPMTNWFQTFLLAKQTYHHWCWRIHELFSLGACVYQNWLFDRKTVVRAQRTFYKHWYGIAGTLFNLKMTSNFANNSSGFCALEIIALFSSTKTNRVVYNSVDFRWREQSRCISSSSTEQSLLLPSVKDMERLKMAHSIRYTREL